MVPSVYFSTTWTSKLPYKWDTALQIICSCVVPLLGRVQVLSFQVVFELRPWPVSRFDLKPLSKVLHLIRMIFGMGQDETTRIWTAGFSPWFHLPGCILGTYV